MLGACAVGSDSSSSGLTFGGGSAPASDTRDDEDDEGSETGFETTEPLDTTTDDSVGPGGTETAEAATDSDAQGVCGDGIAQPDEGCDTDDFAGQTCLDFGFDDGALICDAMCSILTEGCRSCGDDTLAASELCDGADLAGETCESQGFGSGVLACGADCTAYDTSGCAPLPSCGDGMRNGAEQCDGADLGGASCSSLGFDAGSLSCNPGACTHNTSNCEFLNCGGQGDFCLFDPDNPQGTCCAPGVGGNVLGICVLAICQ